MTALDDGGDMGMQDNEADDLDDDEDTQVHMQEEEDNMEDQGADENDDSFVRELFEQEEVVLNMHMGFIAENAQLLSREGSMLQDVQKPNVTAAELDQYATELESILDRKEDMIIALQEKLSAFQTNQSNEANL